MPANPGRPSRCLFPLLAGLLLAVSLGCAPARNPLPLLIVRDELTPARRVWIDLTGDGSADLRFGYGADGTANELGLPSGKDEQWLELPRQPDGSFAQPHDRTPTRHLLIIADSVPHSLVADMHGHGLLAPFHPPAKLISVFPAMTDPALAEFFGDSPCPGIESMYFDGKRLTDAPAVYQAAANMPWLRHIDWSLPPNKHLWTYLMPRDWTGEEYERIQRAFRGSTRPQFSAYVVSTSGIGSMYGRDGHVDAVRRLARLVLEELVAARGRLVITLLSDHGHALAPHRRLPLDIHISQLGYRVTNELRSPGDVVVPQWGLVSCAALYTRSPDRVARDVIHLEGIELALVRELAGDGRLQAVRVLGRDSEARVTRVAGRLNYERLRGDPLKLADLPLGPEPGAARHLTPTDYDLATFDSMADHEYPDVLERIWRAFDGLVAHTPDVLLSMESGYCTGSGSLDRFIDMQAVHGSLRQDSSAGFLMTTAGPLPPALPMRQARAELEALLPDILKLGPPRLEAP